MRTRWPIGTRTSDVDEPENLWGDGTDVLCRLLTGKSRTLTRATERIELNWLISWKMPLEIRAEVCTELQMIDNINANSMNFLISEAESFAAIVSSSFLHQCPRDYSPDFYFVIKFIPLILYSVFFSAIVRGNCFLISSFWKFIVSI